MIEKKTIIFAVIFIVSASILAILSLINGIADNFLTENAAFCVTVILAVTAILLVKDYSKPIAVMGAFLLFLIYGLFSYSIDSTSLIKMRGAIIFTQAIILFFALICAKITQKKTMERVKQEVSKYVTEQVLDNLDDKFSLTSKGTKEILTVMFIDIRGFTGISEKHTAEEVTEILNNYFKEIIPVIKRHGGIINKFIGDALLVVFKGENEKEHAQNAVKAGRDILRKLKTFRHLQEAEGKEKITAGIGINTGEVFVGYIGTEDRCEYTVIGDTVNIASRTESINRIYKTDFLITESTYNSVKDIADVIKISDVSLKGKREKVNVYEVLRVAESD